MLKVGKNRGCYPQYHYLPGLKICKRSKSQSRTNSTAIIVAQTLLGNNIKVRTKKTHPGLAVEERITIIDNTQLQVTGFFTVKRAKFDDILLYSKVTLSGALFKPNTIDDDFSLEKEDKDVLVSGNFGINLNKTENPLNPGNDTDTYKCYLSASDICIQFGCIYACIYFCFNK